MGASMSDPQLSMLIFSRNSPPDDTKNGGTLFFLIDNGGASVKTINPFKYFFPYRLILLNSVIEIESGIR